MTPRERDIRQLMEDLAYIKEAVAKSNTITKYLAVSRVLRTVALAAAALVIGFSGIFYLLIRHHGSYGDVPAPAKGFLYLFMVLLAGLVGFMKLRNFMRCAREFDPSISLRRFVKEVYTPQFLSIVAPFFVTMVVVLWHLSRSGLSPYIAPFLAILSGLLCFALLGVLHVKEMMAFGGWTLGAGLLSLWWAPVWHPLLSPVLTFGLGFVVMFVASYLFSAGKE